MLLASLWIGLTWIVAPIVIVLVIAAALWLRDLYGELNEMDEFDPLDRQDSSAMAEGKSEILNPKS